MGRPPLPTEAKLLACDPIYPRAAVVLLWRHRRRRRDLDGALVVEHRVGQADVVQQRRDSRSSTRRGGLPKVGTIWEDPHC